MKIDIVVHEHKLEIYIIWWRSGIICDMSHVHLNNMKMGDIKNYLPST